MRSEMMRKTTMKSPLAVALAVLLTGAVAPAQPLEPDGQGWLTLEAIGVTVDVPAPFVAPGEPPIVFDDPRGAEIARWPSAIELVRFAVAAVDAGIESPRDAAAALYDPVGAPIITYEVDRSDLGVVSGYDEAVIFYGACKLGSGRLACFSVSYPEAYRALVDPAIGRVLRSMR